jgi:HTH-type transcriptional regulator/antitoxin HipB
VADHLLRTSAQLAVHLKSLREQQGLTQAALGQRIGVGQARIAAIERNPGAVQLDQLMCILHVLQVHLVLQPMAGPADADTPHGVSERPVEW